MKLWNFTVLFFSRKKKKKSKIVHKMQAEHVYKPGGYQLQTGNCICSYVLCVWNEHLYLEAYLKSWCSTKANTESYIWNSLNANWLEAVLQKGT